MLNVCSIVLQFYAAVDSTRHDSSGNTGHSYTRKHFVDKENKMAEQAPVLILDASVSDVKDILKAAGFSESVQNIFVGKFFHYLHY